MKYLIEGFELSPPSSIEIKESIDPTNDRLRYLRYN